jgi:hypothetical protein
MKLTAKDAKNAKFFLKNGSRWFWLFKIIFITAKAPRKF